MEHATIQDMDNARVEHTAVITNLSHAIYSKLKGSLCRVYTDNLKFQWGDESVEPDVSIVCGKLNNSSTRVSNIPKAVVEVLSPATEKRDRTEKMQLYLKVGVQEYWLVDWVNRKVEIYIVDIDNNDVENFYLVRTVTDENKKDLWFATLPHVRLNFDEIFDFYTMY